MKRKLGMVLCFFLGLPFATQAAIELPDLGEPVPPKVSYPDIVKAIWQGNYEYAKKLIATAIYKEIRQKLNDEKFITVVMERLQNELNKIFSDPSKTNEQKGIDIMKLIEGTLSQYKSTKTGNLNVMLEHSVEYGVTRVTWDDKVAIDKCKEWVTQYYCDTRGCTLTGYETTIFVRKTPDYYVYRILGGKETLLTKLEGHADESEQTLSVSGNVWGTVKSAYKYFNYEMNIDQGRSVWFDFNSDYRNKGQTLSYKIVSDDAPYGLGGTCTTKHNYISIAHQDTNGDGKADYIPETEYAKYFGKYYGWLVPTILLLQ